MTVVDSLDYLRNFSGSDWSIKAEVLVYRREHTIVYNTAGLK
jgi:hypothetical protein